MNFTKRFNPIFLSILAFILITIAVSGQETWFEINPGALPPERAAFGMIYDQASERPILFGGFNAAGKALNDTWAFEGNDWITVKTSTEPPARYFHSFTYNPNSDTGILVGGRSDADVLSNAWEYSNGVWRLLSSTAIPGRHSHAAAYDNHINALYILGGLGKNNAHLSDFWMFEPDLGDDGIWTRISLSTSIGSIYGHSMVYDAYHRQIVLFGGADSSNERNNDTWTYKNGQWNYINTTLAPSPRMYHKMIYDPDKERVVLFGGFEEGKRMNDMWIFNGEDWIPQSVAVAPQTRSSHEMVYDTNAKRINCVGGIGSSNNYYNDFWVFYEALIRFDKDAYTSIHDWAVVTVVDLNANLNPYGIDTVSVIITSDTDPVGISLTLTETGVNTGIFMNESVDDQLRFSLIETNQDLNTIRISDGDAISARYTSPSEIGTIAADALWTGIETMLMFDKPIYIGYQDSAILTIDNPDANMNPNAMETITVHITSDSNPDGIDVVLTELSENSGVFTFTKGGNPLTFHPKYSSVAKVEIAVNDRDTLRMTYHNPYDGSVRTATALWIRSLISLEYDKDIYVGNEKASLILYDSDLNLNPELEETVWLQITSDTDPVGYGILATETGPNTGIFDPGPSGFRTNGTTASTKEIHVTDGDVVTAYHTKHLKTPITAMTKWINGVIELKNRPRVFIIFGPEDDEVTSETAITFHFSASGEFLKNVKPRDVEFKTKLLGYETQWTPWIQGTTRSYNDLPGGEYTFMIKCRDTEGQVSIPVFRRFYVIRDNETPLLPPELIAIPGDNFIYLQWTHPYRSNLLGYNVYRREEGKNIVCLNPLPLNPESSDYLDAPVIPHRRYEYFVRAITLDGWIKDSNKVWSSATEDIPGNDALVFTEDMIDMGTTMNMAELEVYNETLTEPIYWTLYTDTPALKVEPASGASFGGAIRVKITLDRKGYGPGFHEIRLHVRSNAGSYFPLSINQDKAIKIRFSIPGAMAHVSHSLWSRLRAIKTELGYVWVDLTPQFVDCYRLITHAPLDSDTVVDLRDPFHIGTPNNPFNLGYWNMAGVSDKNPKRLLNGDVNGQIDAGEEVTMEIVEKNAGSIEIRSATMVYYSTDEFIEVLAPNYEIINNLGGNSQRSFQCKLKVSENLPPTENGYPFTIYGHIVDTDGYKWNISFDLKAFNYPMRHSHIIDDDTLGGSFGNNNGIIEADEKIELPITTHNAGNNELPLIVYYLDQVTSPEQPIIFTRSCIKSKYPVPPQTSQNVESDFEFRVDQAYAGEQIDFRLTSAFMKPVIYDAFGLPTNYLCYTGYFFTHPFEETNSEGEIILCPVFQFPYSYVKEKFFAENKEGIKLKEAEFTGSSEGWISHLNNPPFSAPEAGVEDDAIYLKSGNNVDCYGFWESPANYAPIIKDNLYRARCLIHSDQEDSSLSPTFRLRAFDNAGGQADILVVSAEGDGVCAPGVKPRNYDLYFIPNQASGDSLRFAWDIINFNPNDAPEGTLFLDSLIIERMELKLLATPQRLRYYGFFENENGWTYSTIPGFFTPAIGYHSNGALQITGIDDNTFGYWENPRNDVIQGENLRLYCAEFTGRVDTSTPLDRVPQIRLRLNAMNHQYAILKNINSAGGGDNSFAYGNKTYKIFAYSPIDEDGEPVRDVPIQAFVDFINIGSTNYPNATLIIDDVSIDIYPPDPIP